MRRFVPVLLLILLDSPAFGTEYTARVVGVSDGDTLTVMRDGRTQIKIRLHGVDAPETGQDFGSRSKQTAPVLAFCHVVPVQPRERPTRTGRRWHMPAEATAP